MNKQKLAKFKKIFEEQIIELEKTAKEIEVDGSGDDVDKAQADSIGSVQKKLSERNIGKIRSFEKALIKINDGTFGECEECSSQIGEKRLLAKPDAEFCINCAEEFEHMAKQFA